MPLGWKPKTDWLRQQIGEEEAKIQELNPLSGPFKWPPDEGEKQPPPWGELGEQPAGEYKWPPEEEPPSAWQKALEAGWEYIPGMERQPVSEITPPTWEKALKTMPVGASIPLQQGLSIYRIEPKITSQVLSVLQPGFEKLYGIEEEIWGEYQIRDEAGNVLGTINPETFEIKPTPKAQLLGWGATALEYLFFPFTMSGEIMYESLHPSLDKEQALFQYEKYLPGTPLYEEYRGLPWYQQLAYEAPAWAAAAFFPSAAAVRSLTPAKGALPTMVRGALAPAAAVEEAAALGLKYGIVIPAKELGKGISAALRKALEKAFDLGLDKWLVRQGIRGDQANAVVRWFLERHERWLWEQAKNNLLKRRAQRMGVQQTAQQAADDVIREAEPFLLEASQAVTGAKPPPVTPTAITPETIAPTTPFVSGGMWATMSSQARAKALAEAGLSRELATVSWDKLTLTQQSALTGYAPTEIPTITDAQRTTIMNLATEKLLTTEAGKLRPQVRRLMNKLVGTTNINQLSKGEADFVIEALERLEVKYGHPPKIPTTTALITQELADKLPFFNEIGLIEKVRPTRQVFEKIGLRREVYEPAEKAAADIYDDLMAFRKELRQIESLVGKTPEARRAIFKALENPKEVANLTSNQKTAYTWFKRYFDKWADDLKIPLEKRRENYVTHIFEQAITDELNATRLLDPALVRALDFITPKTVFNPYLEKRLGQTLGLREDPFAAAEAYESRALRVYHYQPLIDRIRVYEKYLPPLSAKYLRDFITRITGRPLMIDREAMQTFKEFAKAIEKIPKGKELGDLLTRGNMAGLGAYQYASLLYFLWLGFRPTSAIRNLSQHILTLADVGPINFFKGIGLRVTAQGKELLAESTVLRSRRRALLPGVDESFASRWTDAIREKALWMFRQADRQNVSDAFLAGVAEAKALGLPRESHGHKWWIERGDEVAADTQYIYSRMGGAAWSQAALGRMLSPLTTWPENWLELMNKWIRGKGSYVYREYETTTGQKPKTGMSWLTKRKAIILYLMLIGAAYGIEKTTRLKATQYTGWTSMRYLIDMASGQLPALDMPGAMAKVIGGALMNDPALIKQGWNQIRPDRMMGIIRQLENIIQGKTDWLTLFFYLNPERPSGEWPQTPSGGEGQFKWPPD